jgi:hypothetical protein
MPSTLFLEAYRIKPISCKCFNGFNFAGFVPIFSVPTSQYQQLCFAKWQLGFFFVEYIHKNLLLRI